MQFYRQGTGSYESMYRSMYRLWYLCKNCPAEAIKVENFHAIIDYEKCTGCGVCMEKCPKKAIVSHS